MYTVCNAYLNTCSTVCSHESNCRNACTKHFLCLRISIRYCACGYPFIQKKEPIVQILLCISLQRSMLKAFNDVLNLVSVQLLAHDNAPEEWSVKDGRSLMRFYDGLVRC